MDLCASDRFEERNLRIDQVDHALKVGLDQHIRIATELEVPTFESPVREDLAETDVANGRIGNSAFHRNRCVRNRRNRALFLI